MNEEIPSPQSQARQGMDYGEHRDVQQVHAAIQREKREPRVGLEPLSLWLIAVYALALFFGGAYLGRYSGSFSGNSLDPNPGPPVAKKAGGAEATEQQVELTPFERGQKVFAANCQVCHQADGLGSPAQQYPPLAGSEYTNGGSLRHAMIVLKGLHGPTTVKGQQFGAAVMQPWESLGDQKVADVMTYERQAWGNHASSVSKEQIQTLRKQLASHPESFTAPELEKVPADKDIPGGEAAGAGPAQGSSPPQPTPK
jgi:mono/diheme cytochrome c family protein